MERFAAPDHRYQGAAFPSFLRASPNPHPPLNAVVAALEHATLSAKRLSSSAAVDAPEAASALASLRNAHLAIGLFLDRFEPRHGPGDGSGDGDEPMCDGTVAVQEAADAETSSDVEDAEEAMRECGLQGKRRRKRLLPASWPAGRVGEQDIPLADPVDRRRSAIDLVFQFHG